MNATEKFLREVNQAFSEGNTDFLLNKISDDFCWTVVGEKTISGKTEFTEAMEKMKMAFDLALLERFVKENNETQVSIH